MDVEVKCGAMCNTDHYLLQAKLQRRWKCPKSKQQKLWRIDVSGLKQVAIDGEENKKQDYVMWKLCWRKLSGLKDGREVEGDEVRIG